MINFDDNNTLETLSGLTFSLEQIHYDIADLRVIEHCRGADMNFSLIILYCYPYLFWNREHFVK